MRHLNFHAKTSHGHSLLKVETDGCVVEVQLGHVDSVGRPITRVEVLPYDASRGGDHECAVWEIRSSGPGSVRVVLVSGQLVTLHALMFVQGHHRYHSTEFVLTTDGGDPRESADVISRVSYPVRGAQREFVQDVARDMGAELFGDMHVHTPQGWDDHVSYRGYRRDQE